MVLFIVFLVFAVLFLGLGIYRIFDSPSDWASPVLLLLIAGILCVSAFIIL